MLSAGQLDLHHAQSKNDLAGAQSAVATTREGLSLAESGISALQALKPVVAATTDRIDLVQERDRHSPPTET